VEQHSSQWRDSKKEIIFEDFSKSVEKIKVSLKSDKN